MNERVTRSSLFGWSIGWRLTLALVFASLIPTLAGLFIIQSEITSIDTENLNTYVTDRGRNRQQHIELVINRGQNAVVQFVENSTYRTSLRSLYTEDVSPVLVDYVAKVVNLQLVGSGLFDQVYFMDLDGIVVGSSTVSVLDEDIPVVERGTDLSNTEAFAAAQTTSLIGEDQRIIVTVTNEVPHIELVQTFSYTGTPLGYMVGRLDNVFNIIPELIEVGDFLPSSSYLITDDGHILASRGQEELAVFSAESNTGREGPRWEGIDSVEINDVEYIRHHIPIFDLPITLVTEVPTNQTFVQRLDDVYDNASLILLLVLGFGVSVSILVNLSIIPPIQSLYDEIINLSKGDFETPIETAARRDEVGVVGRALLMTRDLIRDLIQDLETRVAERVRDMQATQAVIRVAVSERDIETMMGSVVERIIELFPNIYHAQIFLLDEANEHAVLRASTGEPGRQLLARGHRLAVGGTSVVGQAMGEGRVVIARDTGADSVHRHNPVLPNTRAELAIPLQIGLRVIGTLDVQSEQSDSFTEDQISVLQTLADQIAIAVENTQLYQESMVQLRNLQQIALQSTADAWKEYMNARRQTTIQHSVGGTAAESDEFLALQQQAIESQDAAVGAVTERKTIPFAIPITLRGQVLGVVQWEVPQESYHIDRLNLARELVNRLAVSLDNARLFQESRLAVNRERVVNDIAAQLSVTTDVDEILKTAVREIGRALRVPQVDIRLGQGTAFENGDTQSIPIESSVND